MGARHLARELEVFTSAPGPGEANQTFAAEPEMEKVLERHHRVLPGCVFPV